MSIGAGCVRMVDRAMIAMVDRFGRFDADGERQPAVTGDLARFVLGGPVEPVALPAGPPLRSLRLRVASPAPVGLACNDDLCGWVVRPRGEARRAALLVPGWMARAQVYFHWLARRLAGDGVLVVILDLPLHGPRTPRSAASGARFVTGDLHRSLGHLRQALAETRSLLRSLQGEVGVGAVVATGFSLGGWLAGAAASQERTPGAVLVAPAVDPGALIARSPLLAPVRRALRAEGYRPDDIEQVARDVALPALPPPVPRAVVFAGREDLVVPRAQVEALVAAWRPRFETLAFGHMTAYLSPPLFRRLRCLLGDGLPPAPAGSYVV